MHSPTSQSDTFCGIGFPPSRAAASLPLLKSNIGEIESNAIRVCIAGGDPCEPANHVVEILAGQVDAEFLPGRCKVSRHALRGFQAVT